MEVYKFYKKALNNTEAGEIIDRNNLKETVIKLLRNYAELCENKPYT